MFVKEQSVFKVNVFSRSYCIRQMNECIVIRSEGDYRELGMFLRSEKRQLRNSKTNSR